MPAQLLSLTDGPSLLLDKPILLVGRHEECDVQLNSKKVSRKHCIVAQVHDYLIVRDLGSTNGVRINGVRLKEGILRTGDELTIGNFRYQVHAEPPREVLPPPVAPMPPKPPTAPAPPKTSEDELLEAAEEPVPLTEAPGAPVLAARKAPMPPTMAMILEARRETARAVEAGLVAADDGPGRAQVFTQALGREAILEWEGVGDADERPAAVTPAAIDALLELPVMGLAFDAGYTAPALRVEAEKNASAPSPIGSRCPCSGSRPPMISESFSRPVASRVIAASVESLSRRPAGRRGTDPVTSNVPFTSLAYSGRASALIWNARPNRSRFTSAICPCAE